MFGAYWFFRVACIDACLTFDSCVFFSLLVVFVDLSVGLVHIFS